MKFSIGSLLGAAEQALMPVSTKAKETESQQFNNAQMLRLEAIKRKTTSLQNQQLIENENDLPSKDFDEDPTDLYRLIQMKRWSRTLEVLEKFPEEARVWIYRMEDDHLNIRWRLLPLHAALILKAPDTVVEALLLAFAGAAKMKDDQGSLPLHLVCKVGSDPLVAEMLLTAYPKAAMVEDGSNRNPVALLALFNPPNKTQILASVKKRMEEELVVEASFTAERARYAEKKEDPMESFSIEIPEDEAATLTTSNVNASSEVVESREPPEESDNKLEKTPSVESMLEPPKVEFALKELQEKQMGELLAMAESMDIANVASNTGEDVHLKSKLEDVETKHMNELKELKERTIREAEEARANEASALRARLDEVHAKYETELIQIQKSKAEAEEAEKKSEREEHLARIQREIDQLKAQHEDEIEVIKKTAQQERESARREEREMFEAKLAQFEAKHKSIIETIKTESLIERETTRAAEMKAFEKQVESINARHQKELKSVEERLLLERQSMKKDHEKLFDTRIQEIQQKHNKDLEQFQYKLYLAQEHAREERSHIIDTKLKELQLKHKTDLEKIENKSTKTMSTMDATIKSLKRELEKANAVSTEKNTDFLRSIRGLEEKLTRTHDKASTKVAVLEQTVETLESSLRDARKHSLFLEDHVHNLEEQLEERNFKDAEFEARLNKIQQSWLCFPFGA